MLIYSFSKKGWKVVSSSQELKYLRQIPHHVIITQKCLSNFKYKSTKTTEIRMRVMTYKCSFPNVDVWLVDICKVFTIHVWFKKIFWTQTSESKRCACALIEFSLDGSNQSTCQSHRTPNTTTFVHKQLPACRSKSRHLWKSVLLHFRPNPSGLQFVWEREDCVLGLLMLMNWGDLLQTPAKNIKELFNLIRYCLRGIRVPIVYKKKTCNVWFTEMFIAGKCYIGSHSAEHGLDDVIRWKHFSRYWPFVRGIPRTKASDADLWCFLWSVSE